MPKPAAKKKRTQNQILELERQISLAGATPPPLPTPALRSEAKQTAGAEFNPAIRQTRRDIRKLGRERKRERRAAVGAATMLRRGLAQAKRDLRASGLEGVELNEALKEYTARQVDAIGGARFEQLAIDKEWKENRGELRSDLGELQADRGSRFQEIFQTNLADAQEARQDRSQDLLKAELEAQKGALENQLDRQNDPASGGGLTPSQQRSLKTSRQNALIGVNAAIKKAEQKDLEAIRENPEGFIAAAASKIEGASPVDVRWALSQILRRRQRNKIASAFNPF